MQAYAHFLFYLEDTVETLPKIMGSLFRYSENPLLVLASWACYIQLSHPSNLLSLKPTYCSAFSKHYADVIPEEHTLTALFCIYNCSRSKLKDVRYSQYQTFVRFKNRRKNQTGIRWHYEFFCFLDVHYLFIILALAGRMVETKKSTEEEGGKKAVKNIKS